ncbi:MAG: DUF401 family protein [Eubacteriales bacterium]|nr:DUF401 family protein [Eubacteriales bacterium]
MGILTILIAILVISVMAIKRINIGLAMLAGSAVLIILTPLSMEQVLGAAQTALINPITWILIGSVVLIGLLGYILKNSGAMDIMVDSLVKLLGDARWIMAVLAGVIGALVVPGGAMLSAPMIDQLGDKVGIGAEYKTGVNIIFRHVWYVSMPIIPSMLTAASLAKVTPKELAAQNLPVLLVGLVSAWFLLLHPLPRSGRGNWNSKEFFRFAASILPLLLVIFLYVVVEIDFLVSLALGVLVALFNLPETGDNSLIARTLSTGIHRIKTMFFPGLRLQLAFAVAGVMLFKELLSVSGLINGFAVNLVSMGIPMWLLLLVMPLLIGLATGSHEAAIAISLPIFVPLLSQDIYLAGISFTFIAASIGYMLSPLHLCVILTREYYNSRFAGIYRYLVPVPLIMLATGLVVALIRGV